MGERHERPDDHLVEPMFAGLRGAHEASAAPGESRLRRRRALYLAILVVALALGAWVVL